MNLNNNSNFDNRGFFDDNLSDLLGSVEYFKNNEISYNFRYDVNDEYLKQNIKLKKSELNKNFFNF